VRVLDKNRKVIYNGDSVDGAADAIATTLMAAEKEIMASANYNAKQVTSRGSKKNK